MMMLAQDFCGSMTTQPLVVNTHHISMAVMTLSVVVMD